MAMIIEGCSRTVKKIPTKLEKKLEAKVCLISLCNKKKIPFWHKDMLWHG